jgi:hypothetical protein
LENVEELKLVRAFGALVFKRYLNKPINLKREEFVGYYDLVLNNVKVVRRDIIPLDASGLRFDLDVHVNVKPVRIRRVRVVLKL